MKLKNDIEHRHRSAFQVRRLPPKQREALLRAAARRAERLYRQNPQLTDFEAFGEGDLHGESTAAPER